MAHTELGGLAERLMIAMFQGGRQDLTPLELFNAAWSLAGLQIAKDAVRESQEIQAALRAGAEAQAAPEARTAESAALTETD